VKLEGGLGIVHGDFGLGVGSGRRGGGLRSGGGNLGGDSKRKCQGKGCESEITQG
jgi:hypothetical protein